MLQGEGVYQSKVVGKLGKEVELEGGRGLGRKWDPIVVTNQQIQECVGHYLFARFYFVVEDIWMLLGGVQEFKVVGALGKEVELEGGVGLGRSWNHVIVATKFV